MNPTSAPSHESRAGLPRPAFVMGVTGHTDIPKQDEAAVKERLRSIFEWLRGDVEKTFPNIGGAQGCRGLGLQHTPIIVLSALAPGADSLVAEVALELGKTWTLPGGDPAISVRAPLPFLEEIYRDATTFQIRTTGTKAIDPQATEACQKHYDELRDRIRAQPALSSPAIGGLAERAVFPVVLVGEDSLTSEQRAARHRQDVEDPQSSARHRRYRAAGEYVAAYSDLLLALWDGQRNPNSNCGTDVIVEVKRSWLTRNLIPIGQSLTGSVSGPVLQLPVRRMKSLTAANAEWPPPRFLHPYELKPSETSTDDDPQWQADGARTFRSVARSLERFNCESTTWLTDEAKGENRRAREAGELGKMLGNAFDGDDALPASVIKIALPPLAAIRRRAADIASELDKETLSCMNRMFRSALLGAALLQFFAHYEVAAWDESIPYQILQRVLLIGSVLCAVYTGYAFWRHRREFIEERRYDYRALSEGLRVQFFWCLAGLRRSVGAHYMQRQRNEMSWIRCAISSLGFPFQLWGRWFSALARPTRRQILQTVVEKWVKEQEDYFYNKGYRKNREALHRAHGRGWGLAGAGLALLAALAIVQAFSLLGEIWATICQGGFAALGIVVLLAILLRTRKESKHDERHGRPVGSILAALVFTAVTLVLATVAGWRQWGSPAGEPTLEWLPEVKDLSILAIALALLAAGYYFARAEKQLYAEQKRQYSTMTSLFHTARLRLEEALRQLDGLIAQGDDTGADEKIADIQAMLYELGRESLEENAEWLILHRARPLEPFLGG